MNSFRSALACAALVFVAACSGSTSQSRTAQIWSNGNRGCWGDGSDDCETGGNHGRIVSFFASLNVGNAAIVDDVTGGLPSLQVTAPNGSGDFGFCIGSASKNMCEQRDLREFKNGHLEFDVRLESPAVTTISITLFPSLTADIPVSSLSQSHFTHESIALTPDLFGSDGPQNLTDVFKVAVTTSTTSSPILTFNDIQWTSD